MDDYQTKSLEFKHAGNTDLLVQSFEHHFEVWFDFALNEIFDLHLFRGHAQVRGEYIIT